jgi:hypothetical protein
MNKFNWPAAVAVGVAGTAIWFAVPAVSQEAGSVVTETATATPKFTPAAGTYTKAQSVTIADTTTGAVIYYTTNGNPPTTASTKYAGAISVTKTETLKAIAVATGFTQSAVATAAYTIETAAATPTVKPAAGAYSTAQTVSLADATKGTVIYYTTNGTTPTTASTKYTAAFKVSATTTVKAIAVATGYLTSAVESATYTIEPGAAKPTLSPAPGGYSTAQSVKISDTSTGATIYYTTDGTTPKTSSKKYTAPITVSGTTTINAIAAASNLAPSSVASGEYIIDVGVTPVAGGNVFSNGALDPGVAFYPFGGSTNTPLPAADPTTPFTDGSPALKIVVTGTGGYSGGAFVASKPRSVTAANALVFWAKASAAVSSLKVQLGNDAGALANVDYQVESIGIPLTTSWKQFVIPLPDPKKAAGFDGLFSFADGPNNYTFWVADVEYATVPTAALGKETSANTNWPSVTIPKGPAGAYTLSPATNSVIWTGTVPPLPNGNNLDNVGWHWFTLTSSDPTVASVSAAGTVTGLAPGTTNITATLAGVALPGSAAITVTAPLGTPTTNSPTPTLPASKVTALFDSSGVYPIHAVDSLDQPNFCSAVLTNPYLIAGGKGVLEYQLNACVGITFGDGEAGNTTNTVNASAYTTFHVDIWTPNPDDLQIQLVNNADPGPSDVGIYDAGTLATSTWVSLDIPFASFTGGSGLTAENALQQMLFVSANPGMIIYVDNMYFH